MRQTLTNRQIVFVLFTTIITGAVISVAKTQAVSAGHGAWIPLLCTGTFYGFGAVMIVYLNRMNEGDTLFEYSAKFVGKFWACLLAIVYILFYALVSSYYCISFFQLVKANFLPKTPELILLLVSMPFLGFIAYKGFTTAGRLAELVGFVFFIISIILFVTMFFQGKIPYIRPLYIRSETSRYFSAIINTVNQFAGVTLLTLIPVSKSNKTVSKIVFWTFIGLALFYILDVYGCYAMIGMDEVLHYNYPLIDAIRLVEYKKIEFFQRVDIAYMTIGFIRVFVAKGIVYMLAVEYLCRLLPKAKRLPLVIATGIVFYMLDAVFLSIPHITMYLDLVKIYFSILVTFIIPGALLLIMKVKKNGQKSG